MIPLLVFVFMAAIFLFMETRKKVEERIPITTEDISLRQDSNSICILYVNRDTNRPGSQTFECSLVELIRDEQYNVQPEIIIQRNGLKTVLNVKLHLPEKTSILQSPY